MRIGDILRDGPLWIPWTVVLAVLALGIWDTRRRWNSHAPGDTNLNRYVFSTVVLLGFLVLLALTGFGDAQHSVPPLVFFAGMFALSLGKTVQLWQRR